MNLIANKPVRVNDSVAIATNEQGIIMALSSVEDVFGAWVQSYQT